MNENETKNQAAVALGRLNKGRTSEAKRRTARENGRKGGRPRKASVREDARTGQYVPTVDGKDVSPTSFDEQRAFVYRGVWREH